MIYTERFAGVWATMCTHEQSHEGREKGDVVTRVASRLAKAKGGQRDRPKNRNGVAKGDEGVFYGTRSPWVTAHLENCDDTPLEIPVITSWWNAECVGIFYKLCVGTDTLRLSSCIWLEQSISKDCPD